MRRGARFDGTGRYRYALWRWWNAALPRIAFVMLNPSAADHKVDDPTIRRCIGFAQRWNFGSLTVVNLFAYRTKNPARLRQASKPIGPNNDEYLRRACRRAATVVAAWGVHGTHLQRDQTVRKLLAQHCRSDLMCVGTTRGGHPRHPLYLPASARPLPLAL
jgi:hypothetical protein